MECAVVYASLSDTERINLISRFNNPKDSLVVLVIMHSVSSQGVNLDKSCSRVIVVTNAPNAPLEWQSWGRIIRVFNLRVWFVLLSRLIVLQVSQTTEVQVICVIVKNSHYIHCKARQLEKSVLDLATQSFMKPIRDLLLALLNESNKKVKIVF